jgi:hypothetical protein
VLLVKFLIHIGIVETLEYQGLQRFFGSHSKWERKDEKGEPVHLQRYTFVCNLRQSGLIGDPPMMATAGDGLCGPSQNCLQGRCRSGVSKV